jgi:tetratricopeptide (TPR) repeat protein
LKPILTIVSFLISLAAFSQNANNLIAKGNEYYKKNDLKSAEAEYNKALQADAKNTSAQFNYANTLHKEGRFADAEKQYDETIKNTSDNAILSKAHNNKGLAQIKQHLLQEAIESFKQSLRYNAADDEVRDNLQKALNELKQQQNHPQPKDKKKQEEKPKQNKLNKQQIDKELDRLREEEKHLQQQIQQDRVKQVNPAKDW